MSRYVDISVEDFDPNNLTAEQPLWAMYDGTFRTYTNRGSAIQAARRTHVFKLFSWVGNRWNEEAYCSGGNKGHCDECGCATTLDDQFSSRWGNKHDTFYDWDSNWVFRRRRSKITTPLELLFVCAECRPLVSS